MKRNRKRKRTKRTGGKRGKEQKEREEKEGTSRAERTIQVMVYARQHRNCSVWGPCFMLGSQRSYCHNKTNTSFVDSSEGRWKRRMSSTTDRYQAGILDGHRDRQIRRLRFREEEGSSSIRPELAAFVLALRGIPMTKPMLYLCDNQALLKAVKRWVGEGGKATLVGAPDADILLEAI